MAIEGIGDPAVYFKNLGELHDARVTAFYWSKPNRLFNISVDDINSNFLGLPEYQGLQPADVVFSGITSLDCDVQVSDDSFSIFAVEIEQEANGYKVDIRCSPGGHFKFYCEEIGVS